MEIVRNEDKNGEYDYYELCYLNYGHNIVPKEEADIVIARYYKDGKFVSESFGFVEHESKEEENSDSNNKTL